MKEFGSGKGRLWDFVADLLNCKSFNRRAIRPETFGRMATLNMFILFMVTISGYASGASARLSWNENTEADLSHYNAYRATSAGGPYAMLNAAAITTPTFLDKNIETGVKYFYVVTAVDTSGNESEYSLEVSCASGVHIVIGPNPGPVWGNVVIRLPTPAMDANTTSTYWGGDPVVEDSFSLDDLPLPPPDANAPFWEKLVFWGGPGH